MILSRQRFAVAVAATRVVNWVSRRSGRGTGTVVGGTVGLALDSDLLGGLSRGRTTILVSGTNGKTTTTAMVAAGWGHGAVTNQTGANMPAGLVAALASAPGETVALEADEGWLAEIIARTHPTVVVLLNLSRDQLDRANEVRQLATRWREALAGAGDSLVVANANDPLVVYAAETAHSVLWCDVPTPWLADAWSCPHCTRALLRDPVWHCACGFERPRSLTTVLDERLTIEGVELPLDLGLPGRFNEGNAAMALTALHAVGVDLHVALSKINALSEIAGRFAIRRWGPYRLRLHLAKNPAGFDALLSSLSGDGEVWVAINARLADGHDPSWLYDVPFERLRGRLVRCWGDRRLDLATRLDYAEMAFAVSNETPMTGSVNEVVTVIANYTAFREWLTRTQPC
ncbi:MAG: MurT ligase domain-containing protein [Acidimicrobiales bacterium]